MLERASFYSIRDHDLWDAQLTKDRQFSYHLNVNNANMRASEWRGKKEISGHPAHVVISFFSYNFNWIQITDNIYSPTKKKIVCVRTNDCVWKAHGDGSREVGKLMREINNKTTYSTSRPSTLNMTADKLKSFRSTNTHFRQMRSMCSRRCRPRRPWPGPKPFYNLCEFHVVHFTKTKQIFFAVVSFALLLFVILIVYSFLPFGIRSALRPQA